MPPAARHLDRLRENGGRLVVIDPRLTPTGERADLFLQPVPGTDLALALGVLHLLDARAPSTRRTSRLGPPASTTYDAPRPRGGPSGSSGPPASRPTSCALSSRCSPALRG
ncbi:hypothetical protein [Nocardioides kongjuensis]|uniref:hypothetical protein n=1 Tax=Nocardioides kongjuensis TaxID=349522 RepID=UPI0031E8F399